jgi:hypothetical protein
MYALISKAAVVAYPYSQAELRNANPNTSFPVVMSDEELADWGVVPVTLTPCPIANHTVNISEGKPELIGSTWSQTWITTPATNDEIAQRTKQRAAEIRLERTRRLAECDWTQLSDAPVDASAWAAYRQALRDVTEQAGFPWDVQWPVAPGTELERARNADGTFMADDPTTPNVDEAWVPATVG